MKISYHRSDTRRLRSSCDLGQLSTTTGPASCLKLFRPRSRRLGVITSHPKSVAAEALPLAMGTSLMAEASLAKTVSHPSSVLDSGQLVPHELSILRMTLILASTRPCWWCALGVATVTWNLSPAVRSATSLNLNRASSSLAS